MTAEIAYAAAEKAQVLISLGRYGEARAVLRAAVAAAPEQPRIWNLLAQACLGTEDARPALEAAERAIALDPDGEWGHRLRSHALEGLGRRQDAIIAARRAVECGPDVWATHSRLADLLSTDIDPRSAPIWTEAFLAARRAVELAPWEAEAYVVLAQAHAQRREYREMAAAEAKALELAPEDADTHNNLAVLRLKLEQLAPAGAGFARAAALDPQGPAARNFGLVCRGLFDHRIRLAVFATWIGGFVARVVAVDHPVRGARLWAATAAVAIGWFLLRPVTQLVRHVGRRHGRALVAAVRRNRRLCVQAVALSAAWALSVVSLALPAAAVVATVPGALVCYVLAAVLTWGDRDGTRVLHGDPGR